MDDETEVKTLSFLCRGLGFDPWSEKFYMLWGIAKEKKFFLIM